MKEPQILAFMQNPWFPAGTQKEVIDKYRTNQEFHRRLLARCMSGNRLLTAFGPKMFNAIWWDNVAPLAAVEAAGVTDINMQHVESTIAEVKPDMIICFGKIAEKALEQSILAINIDFLCCHHPDARGYSQIDLGQFAVEVEEWCNQWRINHE